jgi:AcrR family transcriptional regulator
MSRKWTRDTLAWSTVPQPQPHPRTAPRQALQERVAAAILDAAARVLADRGTEASMSDVAVAAGVARATVYRYFPSRGALLEALADAALRDAGARIAAARIDEVPVDEGVRRVVRALVEVGDYFIVLARERVRPEPGRLESAVGGPLRRLLERGQSSGDVRVDVPASWLGESLVGVVLSVMSSTPSLGTEDTIAAITGLYLDGARGRRRRPG